MAGDATSATDNAQDTQNNDAATDTGADTQASGDDALLEGARNPDAVRNAIKAEREAAKAAKQRADDLAAEVQKYKDKDKSEQEKLEEKATTAEQRAAKAEAKALRFEVAASKGVPLSQAHRLQGDTKEDLEADADAFMKDVKATGNGGGFDNGAREVTPGTDQDMNALLRRSTGRT